MKKLFNNVCACLITLAVMATAAGASAECSIYVQDCNIMPGGTAVLNVMMDNDVEYVAFQLDIYLPEGVSPVLNKRGVPVINATERTEDHTLEAEIAGEGNDLPEGCLRAQCYSGQNFSIWGNSGAVAQLEIEADESLTAGSVFTVTTNNIVTVRADAIGQRIEVPDAEFTLNVVGSSPLETIINEGVNGKAYVVEEKLTVVEVSEKAGSVFASDANGSWIRIAATGDVLQDILAMNYIEAETLLGTLSDVERNPTLTITQSPTSARRGTKVDVVQIDMEQKFEILPNQVIDVEGYYYTENGVPTLRAFTNGNRGGGQSLTLNMGWCADEYELTPGNKYLVSGVAMLKEGWSDRGAAGAPARIASTDALAFQNYIVYPLYAPEEEPLPTGITDVTVVETADEAYYDLMGRRVAQPTAGIYIHGGKKVLVK